MRQDGAEPVVSMRADCSADARARLSSAIASRCWKFFDGPHNRNARATCPSGSSGSISSARRQWNSAFSSHTLAGSYSKWRVVQTNERVACARAKAGSRVTALVRWCDRFLHGGRIARGAQPVATHELRISQRVPAVSRTLLHQSPAPSGRFNAPAICRQYRSQCSGRRFMSRSHFLVRQGPANVCQTFPARDAIAL